MILPGRQYACGNVLEYMSCGVVPSRHIVLAALIRGLRPRLPKSCAFVVPSRHLIPNPTNALIQQTMKLDTTLYARLLREAADNPRLRQATDLRTSPADQSQRMLNALLPGTAVPIHRHPHSAETAVVLSGCLQISFSLSRSGLKSAFLHENLR